MILRCCGIFIRRWREYARELNREEEARRWSGILEQLPELAVDERRVLMLSPDEVLKESHRHLSNAMAICPLRLIRYEERGEREIVDATVLDYERLGTGMWVGFSFCWMSHRNGIQGNGEGAWEQLRIFWENFPFGQRVSPERRLQRAGRYSTFHYRPFTLGSQYVCGRCPAGDAAADGRGKDQTFSGGSGEVEERGTGF